MSGKPPPIIGCIPARLHSKRLPCKILKSINNKPLIIHMIEKVQAVSWVKEWVVLVDDPFVKDKIQTACPATKVVLTHSECRNGTERIIDYIQSLQALKPIDPIAPDTLFVNVQADEWSLSAEHIDCLIESFLKSPNADMGTLAYRSQDTTRMKDESTVKVVMDKAQKALYFSRQCIPIHKNGALPPFIFVHLGIYIYRYATLMTLADKPPSALESIESLEQLRALDNGLSIAVFTIPDQGPDYMAINTQEDCERLFQRLSLKKAQVPNTMQGKLAAKEGGIRINKQKGPIIC